MVGAEREGLPAHILAECDEVCHIPIRSESLNAAMAATVAMYEVATMIDRIQQIQDAAAAAVGQAASSEELERIRIEYLGRKAELPQLLRGVSELPPEERGKVGKAANQARSGDRGGCSAAGARRSTARSSTRGCSPTSSTSRSRAPAQPVGRLHLLTQTRRELEDIFVGLGFRVVEGPEVDTVAYNFDGLNHDITHPARQWSDTFYVDEDIVLRTHTSPMQVRSMMAQPPPLYIVIPGACYRRDNDATHTPQFHQLEGLAVDEDITLADLKGTLLAFARGGLRRRARDPLPPALLPVHRAERRARRLLLQLQRRLPARRLALPPLQGRGLDRAARRRRGRPQRLRVRARAGYDPERHQGFAWGMGIERIAALKYGVPDLRLLYENDLRFLEQFG